MMMRLSAVFASVLVVAVAPVALAQSTGDTIVTVGSPPSPFPQNKQNEPAVAIDAHNPSIVVAGANDELDLEACKAGDPTTCPFTQGVGLSGVYFSLDGGVSWTQPTYTGWTARDCLGPASCAPHVGPIGTLPLYFESGLVSDGDPALAFGPQPDSNGEFSWANGSRLYYANLVANFSSVRQEETFKGFEAVAVSRVDSQNIPAAAAGVETAWMPPVIVTKQNAALFSDKEAIWADNAESSPFFGNVYVCSAAFRGQERSPAALPEPITFARSTDGGDTWHTKQITAAVNNVALAGRQGCTIRTDSMGTVYVYYLGTVAQTRQPAIFQVRSFDGGATFERPRPVASVVECGLFDPNQGRFTFDGIAGARTNSSPSADIANGAPFGDDATDEIVLTWCQGPTPSNTSPGPNERALVQFSLDGGDVWSAPVSASPPPDRPDFPAIAISPDGADVYITYDNFLQPWQSSILAPPRLVQGVVRHADVPSGAGALTWSDLHRGAAGDARGSSSNNLVAEFLGDYNYVVATRDACVATWNDVRRAAECPAVDAFRQSIAAGAPISPPAPNTDCPATFGNSDIFGGRFADPTP